jgi:hypothetical protein
MPRRILLCHLQPTSQSMGSGLAPDCVLQPNVVVPGGTPRHSDRRKSVRGMTCQRSVERDPPFTCIEEPLAVSAGHQVGAIGHRLEHHAERQSDRSQVAWLARIGIRVELGREVGVASFELVAGAARARIVSICTYEVLSIDGSGSSKDKVLSDSSRPCMRA